MNGKRTTQFGAMRRRQCGCVSQYGLWPGNVASWSVEIMCDKHATPEYRARIADEAAQETAATPGPRMVRVWDIDTDECREVTAQEAAAGKIRYARRELGAGTPACGEVERQALELLRGA